MDNSSILKIPQDILESARLSADDLKLELAVSLYAQKRLSSGKARELAGMSLWEFRQLISSRRVPPHYDVDDLKNEVADLNKFGRL